MSTKDSLILFRDCELGDPLSPVLRSLTWEMKPGEVWAVTGPNGGGKSVFSAALAGAVPIAPSPGAAGTSAAHNAFAGNAVLVSFEQAAAVIERERANDNSDFVEGGVDEGTSARSFIFLRRLLGIPLCGTGLRGRSLPGPGP